MQQTSLDAYEDLTSSRLGAMQLKVYETLKNLEAANNTILARKSALPINAVTPRVLELRKMGLVIESHRAVCPITKKMTIFWKTNHIQLMKGGKTR